MSCNACEIVYEVPCITNCEVSCEDTCQSVCQPCQVACQASCQDACEGTCQIGCQIACEEGCQVACEQGCETSCEVSCQVGCEIVCENICQTACQVGYQTGCEAVCEAGCESTCCQTSCEGSCQSTEDTYDPCALAGQVPPCGEVPPCDQIPPCGTGEVPPCGTSEIPPCGVSEIPECGTDETPPCGSEQIFPCSESEIPDCGTGEIPDCGTDQIPPCGVSEIPPCGTDQIPDCGSDEIEPCGTSQLPDCGELEIPNCGICQIPLCGTGEAPFCGLEEIPECGLIEIPPCWTCELNDLCVISQTGGGGGSGGIPDIPCGLTEIETDPCSKGELCQTTCMLSNQMPTLPRPVGITYNPADPYPGQGVSFYPEYPYVPDFDYICWYWVSEVETSKERYPIHTYKEEGDYLVVLVVGVGGYTTRCTTTVHVRKSWYFGVTIVPDYVETDPGDVARTGTFTIAVQAYNYGTGDFPEPVEGISYVNKYPDTQSWWWYENAELGIAEWREETINPNLVPPETWEVEIVGDATLKTSSVDYVLYQGETVFDLLTFVEGEGGLATASGISVKAVDGDLSNDHEFLIIEVNV